MKFTATIVLAACLAVFAGCSDTGPLSVAARTAPPKPASPPPGDKGDDEPTFPAGINLPGPAGNPTPTQNPTPTGPAPTNPALPAIPNGVPANPALPTAPNSVPANPAVNPNLAPLAPATNPAPAVAPPTINPAAPGAAPAATPAPDKSAPAAANPFANLIPGAAPPADNSAKSATPPANMTATPIADADKRGKDYGTPDAGLITTPIATLFEVKGQIVKLQLEKAMHDFRLLNNRFPKDEAEYIKEIVQAGGLQLPPLEPGERYWYDERKGELFKLSPKK
jgi:hypothetical protein